MLSKSRLLWIAAGLASMLLTVLMFLPASWLAVFVEQQTKGRISLGDVQGSFWQGSAFIAGAPNGDAPVTPLFPGRFAWKISPMLVFGRVHAELANQDSLSQAVKIDGNLGQWEITGASLILPSERLEGLGSPLNTIGPSGRISLSWNTLQLNRQIGVMDLIGSIRLDMTEMAARMTPIKPLGSYQLVMDWRGQTADVLLKTVKGPLLLSGVGQIKNGRLHFSGKAMADVGQEDRLANLLNLLGQRRRDGDKEVIALEFK